MAKTDKTASHFAKLKDTTESDIKTAKHAAVKTDDEEPAYQAPEDSESRGARRAVIAALIVLAVFGGAYVYGATYFSSHFLPNTSLNGNDVSLKTVNEVAEAYGQSATDYALNISGQDFTLKIDADSVGIDSDGKAYAKAALAQTNPWTWPVAFVSRRTLSPDNIAVEYDKHKLESVLGSAIDNYNSQAVQPADAKLEYDKETKLFAITPEVQGTALDRDAVMKIAGQAIEKLETSVTLTEDDLLKPTVYADDEKLTAGLERVNTCLSATQVLRMDGKDAFTFDSELIGRFAKISDDYEVSLDIDALTEWAQGELSDKLDSLGRERSFTRPDGKHITVSGGTYGWIINGAETAQLIADNVNAGKAGTIDVPVIDAAETFNPGGQDWGNRYIDIDLSEQHVRLYDSSSNLIFESDCVTGNSSKGHDTPTGVYFLNSNKEKGNVKLVGEENETTGEPGYTTYVTYWMPFIWDSIALHDASWRYSFGGTVYQTNGSHGCVNLPADKAAELFDISEVGDPVVVHY